MSVALEEHSTIVPFGKALSYNPIWLQTAVSLRATLKRLQWHFSVVFGMAYWQQSGNIVFNLFSNLFSLTSFDVTQYSENTNRHFIVSFGSCQYISSVILSKWSCALYLLVLMSTSLSYRDEYVIWLYTFFYKECHTYCNSILHLRFHVTLEQFFCIWKIATNSLLSTVN